MRENCSTAIIGNQVVLVPYRDSMVETYHAWMEDAVLRESTASERLTFQEERDMQQAWLQDADKCTFIILDRTHLASLEDLDSAANLPAMLGDVNLFLNDPDSRQHGELEVMIAIPAKRRQGFAKEAVTLFISWICCTLGMQQLTVKIGTTNIGSRALFQMLGFAEASRSAVFDEVTMVCQGPHLVQLAELKLTVQDYVTRGTQ